jgi:hypothetical protein
MSPRTLALMRWSNRPLFAAMHESGCGTFETCRRYLKMSAHRGRPEVISARPERRDCRVGLGNFTPSLSQIRT